MTSTHPHAELADLLGIPLTPRRLEIWFETADGLTPTDCAAYRERWLAQAGKTMADVPLHLRPKQHAPAPTANRTAPCIHLGADTGELVPCRCGPKTRLKVFGCARHGKCTIAQYAVDAIQCCAACPDYGLRVEVKTDARERIHIHFPESPGDTLTASAAIESLVRSYPGRYRISVSGTDAAAIFAHNPHVEGDIGGRIIEMRHPLVHECDSRPIHYLESFTRHLGQALGLPRPLECQVNRPALYLSQEERERPPVIKGAYWLVNPGVKSDYTTKGWGNHNYQALVDLLRGRVQFVQVGRSEHNHRPLDGVIDYRGKTENTRDLILLAYHARGAVGPESFLNHVMAALDLPSVVLTSGLFPLGWLAYPRSIYLSKAGMLPCFEAGKSCCWKKRVVTLPDGDTEKNKSLCRFPIAQQGQDTVPRCMDMITPEEVAHVVEQQQTFMRRAVVSAFWGAYAELEPIFGPSHRRYAERIGADYLTLEHDGTPELYGKWQFAKRLEQYERVCWLDGDIWVSDAAPDIFRVVPEDRVGAFNEVENHGLHSLRAVWDQAFEQLGLSRECRQEYFNAGVMVVSRKHADLFRPPETILTCPWAEQTHFNVRLRPEQAYRLDGKWNCMQREGDARYAAYFVHYSDSTIAEKVARHDEVLRGKR